MLQTWNTTLPPPPPPPPLLLLSPNPARGRSLHSTTTAPRRRVKSLLNESSCRSPNLPTFSVSVPNLWGWNTVRGCVSSCRDSLNDASGSKPAVFLVLTWKEPLTTGLLSPIVLSFRYDFPHSFVAFAILVLGYCLFLLHCCASSNSKFRNFEKIVCMGEY